MKPINACIYIFITALILSSCSIQKRCPAPELNLPDEIIAGETDSLTLADMSWWELYSDSTLSKLIRKTLSNNRNMRAAEAHIRQMEELYRVSKANRWPTVGAQVFASDVRPAVKEQVESLGAKFLEIKSEICIELYCCC